ncbi:hypothetical protein F5I97DRAFT_188465 [Phlebopus sp. FC_14]|nr:hypothetical protein F5I97DRAFT_188465 [Phlebopus sp. FC_14]
MYPQRTKFISNVMLWLYYYVLSPSNASHTNPVFPLPRPRTRQSACPFPLVKASPLPCPPSSRHRSLRVPITNSVMEVHGSVSYLQLRWRSITARLRCEKSFHRWDILVPVLLTVPKETYGTVIVPVCYRRASGRKVCDLVSLAGT